MLEDANGVNDASSPKGEDSSLSGKSASVPTKDYITILLGESACCKIIRLVDGRWVKETRKRKDDPTKDAFPYWYEVMRYPVHNVDDLRHWLETSARLDKAIFIHGTPKPSTPTYRTPRQGVFFNAEPHRYIVLDFDSLGDGMPVEDPAECARIARDLLPPEFHGAKCAWSATGTHGLGGKAKIRLFFWLSRFINVAECAAWVQSSGADCSIYRSVQPVYLGQEVIGGPDPVKQRWGILRGAREVVVPADLKVELKATAADYPTEAPANVVLNAPHMAQEMAKQLADWDVDRFVTYGRHNTVRYFANCCLDRGVTEAIIAPMVELWMTPDSDSEQTLADAIRATGCSEDFAQQVASDVRRAAEGMGDVWAGDPFEPGDVDKQIADARRGRPPESIGKFYSSPPTNAEAFGEVEDEETATEPPKAARLDDRYEWYRSAWSIDDGVPEAEAELLDACRTEKPKAVDRVRELLDRVRAGGVIDLPDSLTDALQRHTNPPKLPPGIVLPTWRPVLELEEIPSTSWLAYPSHARGVVSALVGPGGVAKTRLGIAEALAFATGRPEIAGFDPGTVIERTSVWFFCQEDAQAEIDQKVAALRKHWKVPASAINGSEGYELLTGSGLDKPMTLASMDPTKRMPLENAGLALIIGGVKRRGIGLVVLDPVVELHELEENDAVHQRIVWGAARRIATESNAHVIMVTHTRKSDRVGGDGYPGDINTLRGSGAVIGVIRFGRTVLPMTEKDARTYRVDDLRRSKYLRVDDAKNNLAPMRTVPVWFEKVSIRRNDDHRCDVGILVRANIALPARTEVDLNAERVADVLRSKAFKRSVEHALNDVIEAVEGLSDDWGEKKNWAAAFRSHVLGDRKASEREVPGGKIVLTSAAGKPVQICLIDISQGFGAVDDE